jgi:hypothetical protein
MSHNTEDAMTNPFRIKAVADRLWKQCAKGLFVTDMRNPESSPQEANRRYVHSCTMEDPSGVILTLTRNDITDLGGLQENRVAFSISSQKTADVEPETLGRWVRALFSKEVERGALMTYCKLDLPPHEGQSDPTMLHQYTLHCDELWRPLIPPSPTGEAS